IICVINMILPSSGRDVGVPRALLIVHSNWSFPSPVDLIPFHSLDVSQYSQVVPLMKKIQIHRQPPPYETMCEDRRSDPDLFARTKSNCFDRCVSKSFIELCSCHDAER